MSHPPDEPEKRWDAWNESGGPKYPHEKAVQFTFRNVPAHSRRGAPALDAGCGGGVHTAFLAREGFDVTAFDISPTGVERTAARLAAEGLAARLFVSPIQSAELPADAFDLVLCIGVLDCAGVENAALGVRRIAASMRPGGRGVFVFASDRDFRPPSLPAWNMHGFSAADVDHVFGATGRGLFSEVLVDRYITTYGGGQSEQNDWLVTVRK